ncbi:hypothetical protein TNCV_848151 [Trichonephila clavipes]|uniref:Uncharacterized protein n=1 Tax=Trichonephila clavipes TaxID=2585209 RepID=A0A8X6RMC8_TRICX|nr:hypothetical protein TNCV_848151 [Trichonephila clavipes]
MSTKEREINPSKRKTKKSKSSGRNANKTSDGGLLTTFWIFFRCGQLIFRMADCEVEAAIASLCSIPPADSFEKKREGNVLDGKRSSERRKMRTT